ncbi:hypothetical protein GOC14_06895 [Sinorhizobium meliloti]|nr:hypothetical protein [Sinorhizobium meliloti]
MQFAPPENTLPIWVVCWNPADFPGKFTARRNFAGPGVMLVDKDVIVADRLITIRRMMIRNGLTRLPRQKEDDPVILEVWL